MKKIVVVLVSLVVAVLVIVGNRFAQDKALKTSIPEPSLSSEWKLLGIETNGATFYFNTKMITYLPEGLVKVWTLWVPRGEDRREVVNALKKILLYEGKDPNNAERLWYYIKLIKFNCKNHQFAVLENTFYSFEKAVLDDESNQHEKWSDIPPGSPWVGVVKFICNKPSIPDPSLSSEWKLVAIDPDGSTVYVDTKKITYLPEGLVKVWTLWVPRGELREEGVNFVKKILLYEGKDPNNAERLWYNLDLYKFNCKTHQRAILETTVYSFGQAVLYDYSFQHEKWGNIVPKSAMGNVENYVCK